MKNDGTHGEVIINKTSHLKKLVLVISKKINRNGTMHIHEIKNLKNDLIPSKKLKYYNIEINTSREKKAGTSAKVFITLKGDNWESSEYNIDTISDDFEKAMIRHDNSNSKPG